MSRTEPLRLTRAQVREIDRRSIEQYHIPGIVLMENAARAVADVVQRSLVDARPQTLVICGGGNNGGDGLAVARHLHNRRIPVRIALTIDPETYSADARTNWRIVQAMKLPVFAASSDSVRGSNCCTVVDAIFGTGLTQPPRAPFGDLVKAVSSLDALVIAVDLPSGLDCDTGQPLGGECISAQHTVTFVAEKAGFANPASRQYTGEITVADIGCPRELIEEVARRGSLSLGHGEL